METNAKVREFTAAHRAALSAAQKARRAREQAKQKLCVYVAGPMSGYVRGNEDAFVNAAADLRARGIDVVSPLELQGETSFDPNNVELPTAQQWGKLLARDVRIVAGGAVNAVVVLPGYRESRGARLECFVAVITGLPVLRYPSLRRVPNKELARAFVQASALGISDIAAVLAKAE